MVDKKYVFGSLGDLNTDKIKKKVDKGFYNIKNNIFKNKFSKENYKFKDEIDEKLKKTINESISIHAEGLKSNLKYKFQNYTFPLIKKVVKYSLISTGILTIGYYTLNNNGNQNNINSLNEANLKKYDVQKVELEKKIDYDTTLSASNLIKKEIEKKEVEVKLKDKEIQKLEEIVQKPTNKNNQPYLNKKLENELKKEEKSKNLDYSMSKIISPKPAYANNNNNNNSKSFLIIPTNERFFYFPVRGDTLSKISEEVTGSVKNWKKIQEYSGLCSDRIEVNQPLRIPSELVLNNSKLYNGKIKAEFYIAKKNDTLESISRKKYGSSNYANEILDYNRKFNSDFSKKIWEKEWVFIPKS
jgi:nucleoid-associated protein YgaU